MRGREATKEKKIKNARLDKCTKKNLMFLPRQPKLKTGPDPIPLPPNILRTAKRGGGGAPPAVD